MARQIGRREFMGAVATTTMGPYVLTRGARAASANGQVRLGCIGMGNHGVSWNLAAFLKIPEARVLAVCDVYRDRREKARGIINDAYGNQDCEMHADFREILARPDIDAVVISTPDHWHVMMSVMAARAGKHVFCEKPTLTIEEGQRLIKEIAASGVVYQGGIEDRSVEQYHRMAELVRNGILGKLERINIKLPEGEDFAKEEAVPVPDGLDYEMWLGPAPYSPYTPTKLGAQQWRNVWDYSGGKLTDWGAHLIDTAQLAIHEQHGGPVEIDGKGEFPENSLTTTATRYEIKYRYAGGVGMEVRSGGTGIRFIGSDGWLQCPSWRAPLEASDPAILEAVIAPDENKMGPRPADEHRTFIDGVRGGRTPYYTPTDIHRLSTAMHLGNISMRLGRKLKWDPVKEEVSGDDEANAMRARTPREPWAWDA